MREASAGKDTITGHWEMAGLVTDDGDADLPERLPAGDHRAAAGGGRARRARQQDRLGDGDPRRARAASTCATGDLIVYTSADSVFQIAAHEEVVPLAELYRICEAARAIADQHQIGRVIARPFVGTPGAFRRTYNRRDYLAGRRPRRRCSTALADAGVPVVGVGKISDIFAGRGVAESLHSEGNRDGMRADARGARRRWSAGLLFVNLVDFDMLYGHRNDAPGFARALDELDGWLPRLEAALRPGDVGLHHRRSRQRSDHARAPITRASTCRCWRSAPPSRRRRPGDAQLVLRPRADDRRGVRRSRRSPRGESFLARRCGA